MQYLGIEVDEPFGFTETQVLYRVGIFHYQGVVAVYIDICPYPYFLRLYGCPYQGGGVVASALFQTIGLTKGIPANLKYYRTDFVPKDAEEVSEELLSHIAEMVQLENGVKLDGREYILVMSDDEADVLEQHWSEYTDVKALYVSKNVLFTTKQNALFKNVEIHTIPDYYFKFEMQEAGEAW